MARSLPTACSVLTVSMSKADDPIEVALQVASALEAVGAEYFVGGSVASSFQGEPRSTNDVDTRSTSVDERRREGWSATAGPANKTGAPVRGFIGRVGVLEPGFVGVSRVISRPVLLPPGQRKPRISAGSAMSKSLRPVGYWREPGLGANWPDPGNLVDPEWRLAERDQIAAYLKRGIRFRECLGYACCRLGDVPEKEMGCADLSDGRYIWPEGLWIYVARFDVRIPDDMVEHMRANNFKLPEGLRAADIPREDVDLEYWENWSRNNVPA